MNKTIAMYAAAWDRNAERDARWAILTDTTKLYDWDLAEFLRAGEIEIGRVVEWLAGRGIHLDHSWHFLDFGCGIGRVSRALAGRFEGGIGLDISERMISEAREINNDLERRLRFVVNREPVLSQVPTGSIGFVYSHIVLQHVPNALTRGYIAEFMRVLRPGGLAVFQLPTGVLVNRPGTMLRLALPSGIKSTIKSAALRLIGMENPFSIEMHVLSERAIRSLIGDTGTILDAPYTNSTDTSHNGEILFFDRQEAKQRIRVRGSDSPYLSQMFIVRRR